MAPRTTRSSTGGQTGSGHKRVASTTATAAQGKRAKTVTAVRSRHFKGGKDEAEPEEASADHNDSDSPSVEDEGSDFEARADEQSNPSEESETEPDSEDFDDEPKRKKTTPSKTKKPIAASRGSNATTESASNGKTGYGPGTQVIIKKPKARPAGKTPYKEDTIHPNTLLFLADLKANNNRQWLKSKFAVCCLSRHFLDRLASCGAHGHGRAISVGICRDCPHAFASFGRVERRDAERAVVT